jgi:serine/threonine protein kinase
VAYALHTDLGEYRLLDHLGRGGMGDVYRASHRRLGRVVALKTLRDPALAARFLNEARIQGGLSHPSIATLYDYFEADGRACIVMELVEGDTLADRLRQRGPMRFDEAMHLFRPIVEAVAYLHTHGIIHRDLKAHNVKVTPNGTVKLLDFGIAKDLGAHGLTAAGMVPGTPEYLSPEQVQGRPPDARSDVWALGVLLYELVTGDVPFQAPSAFELFKRITRAEYAPPSARAPGLDPACDALVARCLRADPNQRFASASALQSALPAQSRARAVAPSARPPSSLVRPVARAPKPSRPARNRPAFASRIPARAVVLGGAALGLVIAVAAVLGPRIGTEEPGATVQRAVPEGAVPTQVIINTIGAPAEVYRNGERLGATPLTLDSYVGEPVELVLRRSDAEAAVAFETSIGKRSYSFPIPSP